ncbi:tRNA (adenosine(37)-N6)-threonylcarbamoyltransferase complex ATPase subunit type 1 TsaE [Candidatus Trichorickettsia mobilis]|uniref:tRNA (adenosine(37)-N6)-threonylcarbamoyltransferase complex ATPase subunit type 1 TsaE n=1 Tax=Candidatus Trichorickettsia mobilis TaxID=1346319 RepID=UPI00292E8D4B|nr:tRNA (adenosine(37)-N6)-threonylcarbamoyltransferase complex ATPase subunit type 1 TsaE [Candidatus Trichorickettsia mobilis]
MIEYILQDETESAAWAGNFATTLKASNIVTFSGDLGSGKTFLCREIIRYFCGAQTNVSSPTFNLLQTYQNMNHEINGSGDGFTIYHFDLYRLKHSDEVFELGIEEAWYNNLCLIEWPEIIESILPKETIKIHLQVLEGNKRALSIGS